MLPGSGGPNRSAAPIKRHAWNPPEQLRDQYAVTRPRVLLGSDLAAVSSKYIGETSKNIDAMFDAAERADAALLIDEADALFGKRAEVNDAHDRYANIDVHYLLQRIERFNGFVILATNLRDDIDAPCASRCFRDRCCS